ncbi:calcium homeostasis modulator protein 6-like [Acropora muricata]|uniref:calcium homeostasis modulator protein 6-like n=1 Tax=Acropora muricata TaxID=159855 RepID=UPI0034E5D3D4
MNTILSSLSVVLRNSKRSLIYVSTAAITIGAEELFGSLIFSCPCNGHLVYGLAFLFAPAFLLFLPGVLLQKKAWTYQRTLEANETHTRTQRYVKVASMAFDLFLKASVAPIFWLVLSLLKQQYYTCAFFGPSLENKAFANTSDHCFKLESRSKELEENYRAHSQIIGWALLLIALLVAFIKICISRCAFEGKRLELPSPDYYRHVEAKTALETFHLKAKEIAKQNAVKTIDFFFDSSSNKEIDTCIEEVSKLVQKKYGMFFVIPPENPNYESSPDQGASVEQFQKLLSEVDGVEGKREHSIEMRRLDCSKQNHVAYGTPDHTHNEYSEAGSYRPRRISFVKCEGKDGRHTVLSVE